MYLVDIFAFKASLIISGSFSMSFTRNTDGKIEYTVSENIIDGFPKNVASNPDEPFMVTKALHFLLILLNQHQDELK